MFGRRFCDDDRKHQASPRQRHCSQPARSPVANNARAGVGVPERQQAKESGWLQQRNQQSRCWSEGRWDINARSRRRRGGKSRGWNDLRRKWALWGWKFAEHISLCRDWIHLVLEPLAHGGGWEAHSSLSTRDRIGFSACCSFCRRQPSGVWIDHCPSRARPYGHGRAHREWLDERCARPSPSFAEEDSSSISI